MSILPCSTSWSTPGLSLGSTLEESPCASTSPAQPVLSAIPSPTMSRSQTSPKQCPFCNNHFLKLGNHLSHCRERKGADYLPYLSVKTVQKRVRTSRRVCPKCQKSFKRLIRTCGRVLDVRSSLRIQTARSPIAVRLSRSCWSGRPLRISNRRPRSITQRDASD